MKVFLRFLGIGLLALLVSACSDDIEITPESQDTSSPVEVTVTDVRSLSDTIFQLTFSSPVDPEAASDIKNYQIFDTQGNTLKVILARVGIEGNTVLLTTDPQGDATYRVTVSNIFELSGSSVVVPSVSTELSLKTAVATSNTRLILTFSESVAVAGAENMLNYQILSVFDGQQLAIKGVELSASGTTVTLITGSQQNVGYSITASNLITSDDGQAIDPAQNSRNFLGSYIDAVIPDAPVVVGAISTSNSTIVVTFSSAMNDAAETAVNYSVVQQNVNSEVGALAVISASFYGPDRKTVLLTTLSQNETTYNVTVVNVQDIFGQPFQVKVTNTGFYSANNASFAGTPPNGSSVVDFDGDGLLDNEEQRGWLVSIVNGNGQTLVREVSSDPTSADTDGDGLSDAVERSLNIDPRTRDTDGDLLADAHEYNGLFSAPSLQDTDRDGLMDGEEVNFYRTSPLLDDTDGDQILDGDEVVLANRNARIADLAQPTIEIESIALELDVRFDKTKDSTVELGKENIVSATLTQSDTKSHAKTNEENNKVTASVTAANSVEMSGVDTLFIPKGKFAITVAGGAEHGWSSSWSSESSKTTQNEYNKSLTTSEILAEGTTVSRRIESAKVSTLVYLAAEGDVAFTISDLQITALVADIRNPGKYLPVATLVPDFPTDSLNNAFNLGPLADKIGPIIFTAKDIFPAQVERLMRDPSGVIFKISNYNITDESGRNFAYSSQDVVDRTSSISLDFGGAAQNGDGIGEGTEFYRVATSFGRPIGSVVDAMAAEQQMTVSEVRAAYGLVFDDVDSLISYDLSGKNTGVAFNDVMQNVLGLKHYDSANDIPESDASGRLASYATIFNINGVERITRIRQIENGVSRQWSLLTPTGLILDAQLSFGSGAVVPNDQVLLPGSGISLAYVTDDDGDRIPARLEYLNGCSDSGEDTDGDGIADGIDTDGDGLSDYLEVFGARKNPDGSYINIDEKWVVDVKSIGTYQGFSSCGSTDTDADGIPDYYEYHGFDSITVVANPDNTVTTTFTAYTGTSPPPRTDAKSQDTDGDGITDYDEQYGYDVQLKFPRLTTGDDPSECTDLPDDTSVDGITLDKVRCTTDPLNPHSDGDALPDGAEFAFFADPTVNDAGDVSDVDGDGLLGREETDGWPVTFTYSGKADFYKTWDINGSVIPPVLFPAEQVLNNQYLPFVEVTCDPALAASDNGCTTFTTAEIDRGIYKGYYLIPTYNGKLSTSSPIIQDTDGDGVRDNIENDLTLANTGYSGSTHPRVADTDLDGRPDFEELYGYPYKASDLDASKPYQGTNDQPVLTDPLTSDTDGDGLSDGDEVNNRFTVNVLNKGTVYVYSDPRTANSDTDELTDAEEKDAFTNPLLANTDEDPYNLEDDIEQALGINPLDANDICLKIQFTSLSCVECNDKQADLNIYPLEGGVTGARTYFVKDWSGGTVAPAYMTLNQLQNARITINSVELKSTINIWWDATNPGSYDVLAGSYSPESISLNHTDTWYAGLPSTSSVTVNWTTSVMIEQNVLNTPSESFCN